jgi:hypothetical protein
LKATHRLPKANFSAFSSDFLGLAMRGVIGSTTTPAEVDRAVIDERFRD